MILVRVSAICAPEGTHLICMPFWMCSLISFAWSWVRNSWQAGGAVLLINTYKLLQSVVRIPFTSVCSRMAWQLDGKVSDDVSSSSSGGRAENAGGSCWSNPSARRQSHRVSTNQAQYNRTQDKLSTAPAKAMASADSVLTATRWIFFECQQIGLIGLFWLSPILWCAAMIIMPWCESGTFSDAKDASENATNLMSGIEIGWDLRSTAEFSLASWRILWVSISVATLTLFTWLWS